ncbi:MAG TPA: hypothetical protein VFR41_09730, partial [Acidimicrobiia bacterium]|nr:hypothetical protein [Acidimicrobiia bacterium]
PAHDPTDDDRARMTAARRAAAFTVGTIRENYAAALKEALPVLDETQQKMAGDLVEKQNADAEAMLRDKLGGRG